MQGLQYSFVGFDELRMLSSINFVNSGKLRPLSWGQSWSKPYHK